MMCARERQGGTGERQTGVEVVVCYSRRHASSAFSSSLSDRLCISSSSRERCAALSPEGDESARSIGDIDGDVRGDPRGEEAMELEGLAVPMPGDIRPSTHPIEGPRDGEAT